MSDFAATSSEVKQDAVGIAVLELDNGSARPRRRTLTVIAPDGKEVSGPVGEFEFIHPFVVSDRSGSLHMVWGEPEPRPSEAQGRHGRSTPVVSLWYSALEPDRGWTPAVLIYQEKDGSRLFWDPGVSVTLDSLERLHVAVGVGRKHSIHHLVMKDMVWQAQSIRVGGVLYTDIAAGPSGELYIVYVGRLAGTTGPGNNVLLVRSEDGGRSWSTPVEISALGQRRAMHPRAFVAADGIIHLVWGQSLSGGTSPEAVRHVMSRDDGRTWSVPQDVDLPDPVGAWVATLDRCGAIHLLDASPPGDALHGRELLYARWIGGWTQPQILFPGFQPQSIYILSGYGGSSVNLFISAQSTRDGSSTATTQLVTSELRVSAFFARRPEREGTR